MKPSRIFTVFILWLLFHSILVSVIIFEREYDSSVEERNSTVLICCGYETPEELYDTKISDISVMFGGRNSILKVNSIPISRQGKFNYDRCGPCSIPLVKCALFVATEKGSICFRMNVRGYVKMPVKQSSGKEIKQEKEEDYPGNQTEDFILINIPIGGGPKRKRSIQRRSTGSCAVPISLTTASISCRSYPSRVVCLQSCAFGHTLDNGIQQKLECSKKDGVWKPGRFKECKPFVDCTPSLNSGGSVSCSVNSVFDGPECKISCLPYEDKEAVEMNTYACNIDGKWTPPLPFCVTPGSGMLLVKAPQVKLHEGSYKESDDPMKSMPLT